MLFYVSLSLYLNFNDLHYSDSQYFIHICHNRSKGRYKGLLNIFSLTVRLIFKHCSLLNIIHLKQLFPHQSTNLRLTKMFPILKSKCYNKFYICCHTQSKNNTLNNNNNNAAKAVYICYTDSVYIATRQKVQRMQTKMNV